MSHETIYRSLFIQARGALKKELAQHLRSKRRIRRSRHSVIADIAAVKSSMPSASAKDLRKSKIVPFPVIGRAICCAGRATATWPLVERHSRFCMLVKVPGKDTATVVAVLSQHVRQLPATLRLSLTWDRGLEMAEHKSFTMATDVQVYFCDPQSPWQRGSNENTNGLLRQYLPKKADLSCYSQSDLDEIVLRLNQRPEKRWDFKLRRIDCKPVLCRPRETTRWHSTGTFLLPWRKDALLVVFPIDWGFLQKPLQCQVWAVFPCQHGFGDLGR